MAAREKMIAPGGPRPRPSSTKPRRLTPGTEQQIRAMVAQPGTNLPSVRILLAEVDALRVEREGIQAELRDIEQRLANIDAMHCFIAKLYPDAFKAAKEAGLAV